VVSFTRAHLRSPELGFFGLRMKTLKQTPFLCGQVSKAGDFDAPFFEIFLRFMD
jgi:hypothetical protein